ncbi:uncharacterized protein PAN0_005d2495 [Moesziomyces antarcticus]|uniref:Uncharacterized protein n=2 Tax=Pseudozyma antarctica TaxID=84753 RepID=A0A081CC87_PSEA2|nr:uncharacterized protein PAN0_005d2495 [Moesziomyces antarcticus]GAK64283.1 conserved hypothetical protein [Moesziomyces antarcticus]SPO45214.1 uncharacterized protein PSANT_02900 [Moesziomyces antarcticus]
MASPAQALADLLSKARLSLHIPASPTSSKSLVYFDDILNVEIVLSFPADSLLPAPRIASSHQLPLPSLPSPSQPHSDDIPAYLGALLACLHVNLATDYVPESSSESAVAQSKSTNPYEPLSTVQLGFEHLQLLPSHAAHSNPANAGHAAVRAFTNSWAGNQPPQPHRTLRDSPDSSTTASHRARLDYDARNWNVHWHCRVPVNFIATPFAPLLAVTAALTLRLDGGILEHYLPANTSRKFVRAGFEHSLLAPLHEGPVYPDESPTQSQARATASAALGLDGPNGLGCFLAHLPKETVGGNNSVVTPRSGAAALSSIHQRRNQALSPVLADAQQSSARADSNGDLAALSDGTQISSAAARHASQAGAQDKAGLHIYKRSTRAILPLKTGLNVRMRTLLTQHNPRLGRRHRDADEMQTSRLVLCVELENPLESPSDFVVNDILIKIEQHSQAGKVSATPLHALASVLPIHLDPGSQHNLLFYVAADPSSNAQGGVVSKMATRNVNITISGRPSGAYDDFDSQWNCNLELSSVLADAAKVAGIANVARPAKERPSQIGQVAGNPQYSASALRDTHFGGGGRSISMQSGVLAEMRTPRPGQLGMGFPSRPAQRHLSTASIGAPPPVSVPTGFLEKAKQRAANRNSVNASRTEPIFKPWTAMSSTDAQSDGLVVLSSIRRPQINAHGQVSFHSSLGHDGVARPSIATGAKAVDQNRLQFQSGDTAMLQLALLSKATASISNVALTWVARPNPSSENKRDSTDKGRLMDADSARLKSALLSARADVSNGLVPVSTQVDLQASIGPGQTANTSLALTCLSPGYHVLPPLKLAYTITTPAGADANHLVLLDGLGSVHVVPAAV